MSSVKDKTEKLVEYIEEAKKLGIEVLPPDVNESLTEFAVVGDSIRFGLTAIKGVGEAAVRNVIEMRSEGGRFVDLFESRAARRCQADESPGLRSTREVRRARRLPGNRAQKLAALDTALELAARAARDAQLGQVSLFGDGETQAPALAPKLPAIAGADDARDACVGARDARASSFRVIRSRRSRRSSPARARRPSRICATFRTSAGHDRRHGNGARRSMTKTGQQILVAQIEDMTASCDVVVFSKVYARSSISFENDAISW